MLSYERQQVCNTHVDACLIEQCAQLTTMMSLVVKEMQQGLVERAGELLPPSYSGS